MLAEPRQRWPVASLGVFGSRVRGEQHAGSDLDLLVELDGPVDLFGCLESQDEIGGRLGLSVDLSRSRPERARGSAALGVGSVDGALDGEVELADLAEDAVGQVVALQVAPGTLDVVQLQGVHREPLDRGPGPCG
jgi:predicted nucleotidyltransferase